LTEVRTDFNGTRPWSSIWQIQKPTAGTNKILRFTFNSTDMSSEGAVAAAISLEGVEQVTAMSDGVTGATGLTSPATVTVTSAAGDLVIDCVCVRDPAGMTVGAGQTENFTNILERKAHVGSSREAGTSVVMSWTLTIADDRIYPYRTSS